MRILGPKSFHAGLETSAHAVGHRFGAVVVAQRWEFCFWFAPAKEACAWSMWSASHVGVGRVAAVLALDVAHGRWGSFGTHVADHIGDRWIDRRMKPVVDVDPFF